MSKLVVHWCLFCLLFASGALFAVLTDWSTNPTSPIGGGSYSLDSFIYSWALILLNGCAGFIGLVTGLNTEERHASRRALVFAALAISLFTLSAIYYGDNLR